MTVNKLQLPAKDNAVQLKINEIIDNLGGGGAEYSAGTGLSLSGTTFNHSNSVTAGTIGTSSATSGSTISVPYATYDAQGHITGKGTHTHTVTGFLTSSSTQVASSRFDGQWVLFSDQISLSTATSATTTDVTSTIKSNMGASGTDSYKYEVLIQAYCNYKSATSALCAITTNQTTYLITVTSGTTTSRFFCIIPVYSDKVLKFQRTAAMDACTIYFCGYRRIGTNS